ncbi:hypothetical protein [Methylobacter svalbardensis]|uniref:hypothetical protein n=1 Tax=Methylobacter svalbardensis TaxID=3080016 RepID=UPI0030EE2124
MKAGRYFSVAMTAGSVLLAAMALTSNVYAGDVTGDFKVVSATYSNNGDENGGDVTVSGTVNHGAIQSKKSVVVEVTYEIAYTYSTTSTETQTVSVPGVCTDTTYYNSHVNQCSHANQTSSILWIGSTTTTTATVTNNFNGTNGMTAITEPTVVNGRLNPKGKITGYNWLSVTSLVPSALVPTLPAGATLVDAVITDVFYTAYLKDADGSEIADTVISDILF